MQPWGLLKLMSKFTQLIVQMSRTFDFSAPKLHIAHRTYPKYPVNPVKLYWFKTESIPIATTIKDVCVILCGSVAKIVFINERIPEL